MSSGPREQRCRGTESIGTGASAGQWKVTGDLVTARDEHSATLLPNGQVLVAGGRNGVTMTP